MNALRCVLRSVKRLAIDFLQHLGKRDVDVWMKRVGGVIHVGANEGQEAAIYHQNGLDVIWIECLESSYEILCENISRYPLQKAVRALILDKSGEFVTFYESNNAGASSSVYPLDGHRFMWPDVHYEREHLLQSRTLREIVDQFSIRMDDYACLVLDVQGAELAVLKGCGELLTRFTFIQAEAADFSSYAGGARRSEIDDFLRHFGYKIIRERPIAYDKRVGTYFDILWERSVI